MVKEDLWRKKFKEYINEIRIKLSIYDIGLIESKVNELIEEAKMEVAEEILGISTNFNDNMMAFFVDDFENLKVKYNIKKGE